MVAVAWFSDTEGQWPKLLHFLDANPCVAMRDGRLHVAPGCVLVFGGDSVDRGPAGLRLLRLLVEVKRRQPDQVVLLAGNRDINKLRFLNEVAPDPPRRRRHRRLPDDLASADRAALLRWTLAETMSAKIAFACRQQELAELGLPADDDATADSLVDDVRPGGALLEYLEVAQLMWRLGDVLFVHGAVTPTNRGLTPGFAGRDLEFDRWQERLNAYFATSVAAAKAGDSAGCEALLAYQAPLPGQKSNPYSVVYSRTTDDDGTPAPPDPDLARALAGQGVARVVLGHAPIGDAPCVVRGAGVDVFLGDTSYSRLEYGARLILDGDGTHLEGRARLDDGSEAGVATWHCSNDHGPIGRHTAEGDLVAARLDDGRYLLMRGMPGWQRKQVAVRAAQAAASLTGAG
ncbi:MAG: metallophosphoesterase [Deltaproteobacteria bacterium]|nr:metallophosphoesterase [Deltaproteobacteria bacterium]